MCSTQEFHDDFTCMVLFFLLLLLLLFIMEKQCYLHHPCSVSVSPYKPKKSFRRTATRPELRWMGTYLDSKLEVCEIYSEETQVRST